jgi:hypothetical protein
MDFDFFDKLSSSDAKKFLDNFLSESGKGFINMKPELESSGIKVDYTIESLMPVFGWIADRLKTLPENEDKSLPIWIRETESYKKGLYSFDVASRILILRFAYYMGECFIRNTKSLSWNIGRVKNAEKNMPVVTGFKFKLDLSIMMVSENMFSTAIEENEIENAKTAITTWSSFIKE